MKRTSRIAAIAAPLLFAVPALAQLGTLAPPAGPIVDTGPHLGEIEPRTPINATNTPGNASAVFRITQPGSYFLTSDVVGEEDKHGIRIEASDVTIDLNGFRLNGVPLSLDGISEIGASRVHVRNGAIIDWGGRGIHLASATGCSVRDVVVSGCLDTGVWLGTGGLVSGCSASSNGFHGIEIGSNSLIIDSLIENNGNRGAEADSGLVMRGCVLSGNTGSGVQSGNGATIESCIAIGNGGDGFFPGVASVVRGCAAIDNMGAGFDPGTDARVIDCTAFLNDGRGFELENNSSVEGCVSATNGMQGIDANAGCRVAGCVVNFNAGTGIEVGSDSHVIENLVDNNGTGGGSSPAILALSGNQVIDSNTCTDSEIGIRVTGTGALIIRNSVINASGNAYDIAIGNAVGEIVNPTLNVAPILGSTGGGLGRNRCWGNFAF